MTNKDIIEHFVFCETQSNSHSEEYLEAISSEEYLEDLVDTISLWVRECEGDKNKSMMYLIQTLDS